MGGERERREGRRREVGVGGWAAAYTRKLLNALHFISQIIKDD